MIASDDHPIELATTFDFATIAAVLASAHQDQSVAHWVVPGRRERPRLLRARYTILVEHALVHGAVGVLADRGGTAVWLDRTQPVPDPVDHEQRLTEAECGRLAPTC